MIEPEEIEFSVNYSLVGELLGSDDDDLQDRLADHSELVPDFSIDATEFDAFWNGFRMIAPELAVSDDPPVPSRANRSSRIPGVRAHERAESQESTLDEGVPRLSMVDLFVPRIPRRGFHLLPATALILGRRSGLAMSALHELDVMQSMPLERTALGCVFDPATAEPQASSGSGPSVPDDVHPLPLTPTQEAIVRSARSAPLTVVTGPLGTGKSWMITAIVLDALLSGRTVLVASQMDKAVEVVAEKVATQTAAGDHFTSAATNGPATSGDSAAVPKARIEARIAGKISPDVLLRAFPAWACTSRSLCEILPATPALFDLVVIDEASQCDPALACVALLRAKRAVVVGDPHQLRHVCFLSRAREQAAFARCEFSAEMQKQFRYRRSLFDIAADAVDQKNFFLLNEHFRSHPQIIDFSNRRFYDGALHIMTSRPTPSAESVIRLNQVDGCRRDGSSVNPCEVDFVVETIRSLAQDQAVARVPSIGIVSPFRDHADAIRERLIRDLPPGVLENMTSLWARPTRCRATRRISSFFRRPSMRHLIRHRSGFSNLPICSMWPSHELVDN